jgi:hypothetical protein
MYSAIMLQVQWIYFSANNNIVCSLWVMVSFWKLRKHLWKYTLTRLLSAHVRGASWFWCEMEVVLSLHLFIKIRHKPLEPSNFLSVTLIDWIRNLFYIKLHSGTTCLDNLLVRSLTPKIWHNQEEDIHTRFEIISWEQRAIVGHALARIWLVPHQD